MDERRTQKMLDALADMFLSDADLSDVRSRDRDGEEDSGETAAKTLVSSEQSVATDDQDLTDLSPGHEASPNDVQQITAPGPVRLAPKTQFHFASSEPSASPAVTADSETPADWDTEVPVVFPLREGIQRQSGDSLPASRPAARSVEAVFLANLPGFSGPWLTQYARHRAQSDGPVAVLHMVDEERIDLDLVRSEAPASIGLEPHLDSCGGSVLDAIARLANADDLAIGSWLVHLPTAASGHVLTCAAMLDMWTMLCGADDAAVVDAYRVLKQLVEASSGGREQQVQLMVMGSDEARSVAAAEKLSSASTTFLHTPVHCLGHQKQMVPVSLRVLGSFAVDERTYGDLAMRVMTTLRDVTAHPAARSRDEPAQAPLEQMLSEPEHPNLDPHAEERVDELAQLDAVLQHPEAEAPPPAYPPPPPPEGAADKVDDSPSGASTTRMDETVIEARAVPDEPNLNSFLAGMGGIALEARCPRYPSTQLVLDQDGRMHLLRQHRAKDEDLQPALVELIDARHWVRENIDLICLTQRQSHFDCAVEPALHLFTDDAKTAVMLAGRLGSLVKLHLLQQVQSGADAIWSCTELN